MSLNLCSYKNSLGKPGEGFHQSRILGFALYDIIGTIIIAFIIGYISNISFWITFLLLFIVAQILHYIFCVDTEFIKILTNKK